LVASLLIMLREGLEAALIVGIILGYLAKIRQRSLFKHVFGGVGAGILGSIITAFIFQFVAGGFEGKAEETFEGTIMLVAVAILTSMVIWMQKQSKAVKGEIVQKVDSAVSGEKVWGLFGLAFISVFREGVEVVLFLNALFLQQGSGGAILGSVLGLALALGIAYIVFKTTVNLDLRKFFIVTGSLLLLMAAGLLAHGIHELQEAGFIPIIIEHVWDINHIVNEKGTFGSLLKAVFGYNGNPSLIEVIAYLAYLTIIGNKFWGALNAGTNKQSQA